MCVYIYIEREREFERDRERERENISQNLHGSASPGIAGFELFFVFLQKGHESPTCCNSFFRCAECTDSKCCDRSTYALQKRHYADLVPLPGKV